MTQGTRVVLQSRMVLKVFLQHEYWGELPATFVTHGLTSIETLLSSHVLLEVVSVMGVSLDVWVQDSEEILTDTWIFDCISYSSKVGTFYDSRHNVWKLHWFYPMSNHNCRTGRRICWSKQNRQQSCLRSEVSGVPWWKAGTLEISAPKRLSIQSLKIVFLGQAVPSMRMTSIVDLPRGVLLSNSRNICSFDGSLANGTEKIQ